jgi:hypothetical protein
MADQRESKDGLAVAFWCPRELAAKADAVAAAEMMSRSAWLRRMVAQGVAAHE